MIKSQHLSTGIQDAFLCSACETESSDADLGDFDETDVVCNGADLDDDLVDSVGEVVGFCYDFGKGHGCAVGLGEEETAEDNLFKLPM